MADQTRQARRLFTTRRRCRRGYTLVFFAMILFGLMALAALVIDIGFARLTQRQMQVAADSAAVEGLRGDGVLDDAERREAARDFAHWHFDDDLDASGTYPADDDGAFDGGSGQFGAGPMVQFSGAAGDPSLAASQLMEVDPANPVYKPEAVDGVESDSGVFRVALRRGADDTPAADLVADGPAVPYLFARGSLLNRELIADGITVRATSQAVSAPAFSIGLADDTITPPLLGLIPAAIELDYWNQLTTDSADSQPITGGEIAAGGRFFTMDAADSMPLSVGRELPAAAPPTDNVYAGYVPIYANLTATSTSRVVGYGEVVVEVTGGGTMASITRQSGRVGAENVSAVRCYPLSISAAEAAEVLSLMTEVGEALLAPALRSTGP